jgi:hypothetical protein
MHSRFFAILASTLIIGVSGVSAQTAIQPELRPSSLRINMQNDMPNNGDFTVAPTRFVLPMQPGEERTIEVQITNRRGTPAIFALSTEDFTADAAQDGNPQFLPENTDSPYTARRWITPEVTRVQLLHGERAFIRVTVKAPANAEPGDHQAALIVKRELAAKPTSGFGLESRVAALFIMSIPGNIVQEGSLNDIQPRRSLNWWLPVFLRMDGSNNGTVHMAPQGTVDIRNIFGIVVDQIPIENWIILRASDRSREIQWSPRFALGRYTATTSLTAFADSPLNIVSASFWVIPILPLLLLLLAIFTVSFGVRYIGSTFELRWKK